VVRGAPWRISYHGHRFAGNRYVVAAGPGEKVTCGSVLRAWVVRTTKQRDNRRDFDGPDFDGRDYHGPARTRFFNDTTCRATSTGKLRNSGVCAGTVYKDEVIDWGPKL
jgi:hypothetical protein